MLRTIFTWLYPKQKSDPANQREQSTPAGQCGDFGLSKRGQSWGSFSFASVYVYGRCVRGHSEIDVDGARGKKGREGRALSPMWTGASRLFCPSSGCTSPLSNHIPGRLNGGQIHIHNRIAGSGIYLEYPTYASILQQWWSQGMRRLMHASTAPYYHTTKMREIADPSDLESLLEECGNDLLVVYFQMK